jgi:hypothetical protein
MDHADIEELALFLENASMLNEEPGRSAALRHDPYIPTHLNSTRRGREE